MTLSSKTVYLSKRGRKDFKKAVNRLEQERRKIIASLHEQDKINNHEERYEKIERLARLDAIEAELEEKREILRIAKPFPQDKSAIRTVSMGSEVELINKGGDRFVYTLVDSIEADPSRGRVSVQSPLGKTLVGKKPFDTIEWPGSGNRRMQLVRIS